VKATKTTERFGFGPRAIALAISMRQAMPDALSYAPL